MEKKAYVWQIKSQCTMRILLINHHAGGPGMGMEHRPWLMAREWIRLGHEVLIVAASNAHTRTVQPETGGRITRMHHEGIPYLILRTPSYHGNGFQRVLNMTFFVKRLFLNARKLTSDFKPDMVIASSTYPLDIWPASRIAKLSKAKLVFEVHDLWPLSPMELGGYSSRHPFIRLLQSAENFACRKSDKVVSLLPCTLEHLAGHGMDPSKFIYIPNGVVSADWNTGTPLPEEHTNLLASLMGKTIIGYTGAMGISNALEPLIDAAALVQHLPVAFVLVGSGPEKQPLIVRAQKAGLKNLFFAGNVTKMQMPALLDQMDLLYIGFKKNPLYRFGVSPNKIFDYMMAGKPIIQAIEACNNFVAASGCGIAIEPDNPAAIARAISSMLEMSSEDLQEMGKSGRDYVIRNHDFPLLAKRFLEWLPNDHP
jgi:glycosyltransferase involved in cell wall biosynthesis